VEKIGTVPYSDTQMIRIRDDKKTVTFALVNGHNVVGQVLWFDGSAYHVQSDLGEITLLKHAVLHYKVG
jgi:sRNA-binding regulator protein Hfq